MNSASLGGREPPRHKQPARRVQHHGVNVPADRLRQTDDGEVSPSATEAVNSTSTPGRGLEAARQRRKLVRVEADVADLRVRIARSRVSAQSIYGYFYLSFGLTVLLSIFLIVRMVHSDDTATALLLGSTGASGASTATLLTLVLRRSNQSKTSNET